MTPATLLRPHRRAIAGLMLLSLGTTALALAQPWLTKLLIDDGLIARNFGAVVRYAALMFCVALGASLAGGVNRWLYTRLSGRILFALREQVYSHLQKLSPAFYTRNRTGDILARLDGDVAEIQRFALDGLFAAASGVFALVGTVALMLALSPALTLAAAVVIPVQWLWLRAMRPRVRERTGELRERASDVSSFLVETLPAMKYIQAVAATARERLRLGRLNRAYLATLLRLQLTEFATAAVPASLGAAARTAVFVAGGWLVVNDRMALGSLIAFTSYLGMAMGPVQSLLGVYLGLTRVRVSLERVQHLTESPPEVEATGGVAPPAAGPLSVAFENVRFAHAEGAGPVLESASFAIPAGARAGVFGPSGSGKSTLVDLLLRHHDPQAGRVLIGGRDLRELDLAAWRRRVALVAQDVVLFRGSLLDNVRYAHPDASEAQVREALERAQLGEFLAAQPQGLATPIGERGARLSGGERQRLAVARALLQDPLLLILDEATSALDPGNERALLAEIENLFPHTTRILVSHRDTPLAGAELLLEVRDTSVRAVTA